MADANDCWEYQTELLNADAGEEKEYIRKTWPSWRAAKYAPEALGAALNIRGKQRWELVSLHPYAFGQNADVMVHSTGNYHYTRTYLAVFKRRLPQPAP